MAIVDAERLVKLTGVSDARALVSISYCNNPISVIIYAKPPIKSLR